MTVQLGELKDLLENVWQKAQGARDSSEAAEREAVAGSKVRGRLLQVSTGKKDLDQEQHQEPTTIHVCSYAGV